MKKLVYIFFVLALFASFPQTARADFAEGQRVTAEIIAPLMQWVEQETGVRVTREPTVIASRTKLLRVAARVSKMGARPRALYVSGMVLVDHYMFDTQDDTQMSLLVHELVHFAQAFRPRTAGSCEQSKEVEAYTLQNKWLAEHGHAPIVSASFISRMAACPTPTVIAMAQ